MTGIGFGRGWHSKIGPTQSNGQGLFCRWMPETTDTGTGLLLDIAHCGGTNTAKGACNRVAAGLFQTGSNGEDAFSIQVTCQYHFFNGEFALGEGAGLVEDNPIYGWQRFQYMALADQQTGFPQGAGRSGQGSRCRQRQGAGAGDNQHRQGNKKRVIITLPPPEQQHTRSNQQNGGNKVAGNTVGDQGNLGLFLLCPVH